MDVWHAHSLRMLRKKQTSGNNRCELVEVLNWPANAKTSRFCATRVLLVCACLHLWNKHLSLVLDYNELIASKAALASSYLCNTQQLPFSLRWRYFLLLWQSWTDQMVQLSLSAIMASESAWPGVVAAEPWITHTDWRVQTGPSTH